MPGRIDCFYPSLEGWFFPKNKQDNSQLEITVNGTPVHRFSPNIIRNDVNIAHALDHQTVVGFRIDLQSRISAYLHRSRELNLDCTIEVRSPSHPEEKIENSSWIASPVINHQRASTAASLAHQDCVNFYTINFFDPAGNSVYTGGAERYIIDLAELLKRNLGLDAIIYQYGHYEWERYYAGIRIISVTSSGQDYASISESFSNTKPGALNIYSPMALASHSCHAHSIGISHGAYWDSPRRSAGDTGTLLNDIWKSIHNLDRIISVDANTLTSLQALADIESSIVLEKAYQKSKIILNYASKSFETQLKEWQPYTQDNPCNILYARRLYRPRGFQLLLEAIPSIKEACSFVRFAFVGGADANDLEELRQVQRQYPSIISHQELLPEAMPKAYENAHISLIPTLHSEGSSLSCLESMASGCAIVSSCSGGLANIIIDQFNGIVVTPTPDSLSKAVIDLYHNPSHCKALSGNAQLVAKTLSKTKWEQEWLSEIKEVSNTTKLTSPPLKQGKAQAEIASTVFHHPFVGGIAYQDSKSALPIQRPQSLFQLLAKLGYTTSFCSSTALFNSPSIVKTPDYTCYEDNPIIYIYKPLLYAFLIESCREMIKQKYLHYSGTIGYYCYDLISGSVSPWQLLDDYATKIRCSNQLIWFDWIDSPLIDLIGKKMSKADRHIVTEYINDIYQEFASHSSIFTTSSPTLQAQAEATYGRKPHLIGNATFSRFAYPKQHSIANSELAEAIKKSKEYRYRIIYWGAINSEVLDLDLVRFLAIAMPNTCFFMVGPGGEALTGCPDNILTIHKVPQWQLWDLAPYFHASIIPFRASDLTSVVNPLKLHEYIELGLPVLATETQDLRLLYPPDSKSQDIYLCKSLEDWLNTLTHFLGKHSNAKNSHLPAATLWSDMATPLVKAIHKHVVKQPGPWLSLDHTGMRITLETTTHVMPIPRHLIDQSSTDSGDHQTRILINIKGGAIDFLSENKGDRFNIKLPAYIAIDSTELAIVSVWLESKSLQIQSTDVLTPLNSGFDVSSSRTRLGCTSVLVRAADATRQPKTCSINVTLKLDPSALARQCAEGNSPASRLQISICSQKP